MNNLNELFFSLIGTNSFNSYPVNYRALISSAFTAIAIRVIYGENLSRSIPSRQIDLPEDDTQAEIVNSNVPLLSPASFQEEPSSPPLYPSPSVEAPIALLRPFKERALVVGVWRPGTDKIKTLALDPDTLLSQTLHQLNPRHRPDFEGDIMQIPNAIIGCRTFTKIVFQGCCPVATAMGAIACSADSEYKAIDPVELAHKIEELISEEGGHIFFRHCVENANEHGIANLSRRKQFIEIFEKHGFEEVRAFHPPYRLNVPSPGSDIFDPHPARSDKWESRNGGLIFFLPAK